MNSPSIVRKATPDDYGECWRLLMESHEENGLFTVSHRKVAWLVNRIIWPEHIPFGDTGTRGILGVIGSNKHLEGFLLLTIGSFWYSDDWHIEEYSVYVHPDHRRSGHAQAFLQWMKLQVELQQLPLLTGILSTHRTEAKCRLYQRTLPKIGEFFFLAPKGSRMPSALSMASS
jgi:GNAT superfamily N-acetyltransferase